MQTAGYFSCNTAEVQNIWYPSIWLHSLYLESQQAAVDLGRLHQSAAVVAADVGAALVAGQIDQGELAVQRGRAVVAPQHNLKNSMRARGVGVGRGLARCSGETVGQKERERRQVNPISWGVGG